MPSDAASGAFPGQERAIFARRTRHQAPASYSLKRLGKWRPREEGVDRVRTPRTWQVALQSRRRASRIAAPCLSTSAQANQGCGSGSSFWRLASDRGERSWGHCPLVDAPCLASDRGCQGNRKNGGCSGRPPCRPENTNGFRRPTRGSAATRARKPLQRPPPGHSWDCPVVGVCHRSGGLELEKIALSLSRPIITGILDCSRLRLRFGIYSPLENRSEWRRKKLRRGSEPILNISAVRPGASGAIRLWNAVINTVFSVCPPAYCFLC